MTLSAHQNFEQERKDAEDFLQTQNNKDLMRFITCGSVDDGKSTLIGRLLYESKLLYEDQIAAIKTDSARFGTQGADLDFALLVDGLAAEREQGITIDVAYRFFSTEARKFIVIDTPGHEQYTRNMATGASQADLAVLLIDARHGLSTQTKRHSYIVHALGVRKIVLAVNKMDLVDYSQDVYNAILDDYAAFAKELGMTHFDAIPMSALKGDNVIEAGDMMSWYDGPSLIRYLETISIARARSEAGFRMPVQWVNRPNLDFRGFTGRVVSGQIRPGDKIIVMPSGKHSTVEKIVSMDGDLEQAGPDQSITLTLEDEIDITRGNIICDIDSGVDIASDFDVQIFWMSDQAMRPGRTYNMKLNSQLVNASVSSPNYVVDINTLQKLSAETIELNEIGACTLSTETPLCFAPYNDNRDLGGFILIDRMTNATVAMGLITSKVQSKFTDRGRNYSISPADREHQKGQRACALWLTGLAAGGKKDIADAVERRLFDRGHHSMLIDSRAIREGLSNDLDYSDGGRSENMRRAGELSALMCDAGLIALTCFDSPYAAERRRARRAIGTERFVEIFVDTPLEIAESRDKHDRYGRARRHEITQLPGVNIPYETPENPELHIDTTRTSPEEAAEQIIAHLITEGFII